MPQGQEEASRSRVLPAPTHSSRGRPKDPATHQPEVKYFTHTEVSGGL